MRNCNSRISACLILGLLLGLPSCSALLAQQATVEHYHLSLVPDLQNKSIIGELVLTYSPIDVATLLLDIGNLQIDSVRNGDSENDLLPTSIVDRQLSISGLSAESQAITINYRGTPSFGLQFSDDGREVSTAFSTEQWMPVQRSPAQRAGFSLELLIPSHFTATATGDYLGSEERADGLTLHRWQESQAMPAYLMGFAAGEFLKVSDESSDPILHFLAPPEFTAEQLRTVFADTRDAIAFFEEHSGIPYPDADYTQVLLRRGYGQELHRMAVMRQSYGEEVLNGSRTIWLAVHEIAHQWWGNRVTNKDWTHFWLNEGIANFMTAAYFAERFGSEAYEELIGESRRQYELLVANGNDRPLVFPDWDSPSREDRMVVYEKGAYVVHLLREELGDEKFWEGLRFYTERYWNDSVSSKDFQTAMEESSGVDLSAFFNTWVYQ